ALELAREVDRAALPVATRVALAIAMSGARLDLGQTELALGELEIPELDPDRAFEWSPSLFRARAAVLGELGRTDAAAFWTERADVAHAALGLDGDDEIFIEETLDESLADIADAADATAEAPDKAESEESESEGPRADTSVEESA